jgi:iron complex transport system substrate-binding protein
LIRFIAKSTVAIWLISCADKEQALLELDELKAVEAPVSTEYAHGFELEFFQEGTLITVRKAWKNMDEPMRFWLPASRDIAPLAGAVTLPAEPKRIAVISTSHIHAFELIGESDRIVGLSDPDLVYSSQMQERINKGKVKAIGSNEQLNYEALLLLEPDLVLLYGIGDAVLPKLEKLESLGIPYLVLGEYMEDHPLGQAEWMKLIGLLCDKTAQTDSVFSYVAGNYWEINMLATTYTQHPTVFLNSPWEGVWYMPASANFSTQFIEDAGANLLFRNNEAEGWQTLDKEYVFEKAHDADFWLNTGAHQSLEELKAQFDMATAFDAFQNRRVFNNVKRIGAGGGNDYWESGIYRPDIILRDLNLIFHADSLRWEELSYYKTIR